MPGRLRACRDTSPCREFMRGMTLNCPAVTRWHVQEAHGVRPDAVSFGWAMSICANANDVTMTQQLVRSSPLPLLRQQLQRSVSRSTGGHSARKWHHLRGDVHDALSYRT